MASYMPQHVFNMCAVTAVQYNASEGTTIEEFAKRISDSYRRHYIDDGYEEDIVLAAHNVAKFIELSFPGTKAATSVRQLQYCIKKFHPSGKKTILSARNNLHPAKDPTAQQSKTMRYRCGCFSFGDFIRKVSISSLSLVPVTWSLPYKALHPNGN